MAPGAPGGAPIAKSSFGSRETMPSSTPTSLRPWVGPLLIMMCASALTSRDTPVLVAGGESATMPTARLVCGEF